MNEHRVIESNIFSGNRIGSHNVIIVAVIPVLAITSLGIIALWPFLGEIGLVLLWLLAIAGIGLALVITGAAIGACYLIRTHVQHKDRQARLFTWEAGAAWIADDGSIIHLSAEHEQAKLPCPRLTAIEEVENELSPEDKEIVNRSKVLTMFLDQEKGMHAIADETGIPYQKVRDWCNTAKRLRAKADQSATSEGV